MRSSDCDSPLTPIDLYRIAFNVHIAIMDSKVESPGNTGNIFNPNKILLLQVEKSRR